ncbi:AAA ATPase [Ferroglobus placidus DSM 10642]|uniref:AAA ATPase n=1 Tax=Ferroglobus placidus (strain DSM 10642 / AEDII12DO) TaxID=589924 RepID=D3S310_FERPA|nr:AAA domain-containing protein [Ferroglobus placidus]ADC64643.1 AAA ATPase [Ferroglobus placidus DSM 10642]
MAQKVSLRRGIEMARVGRSMLEELLQLVLEERRLAVKEVEKEIFGEEGLGAGATPSRIYTVGKVHLVKDFWLFDVGDTVGVLLDRPVNLGFVVDRYDDTAVVYSTSPLAFNEESLLVFKSENLVGYDLQINLLEKIIHGAADPLEEMASEVVFGKAKLPPAIARKRIVGVGLDEFQKEAVESILALEEGELLLVVGPPGTGKTRVISRAALELADQGEKVLITSHTNRAVDTALERLHPSMAVRVGRPERVSESMKDYLIENRAREKEGVGRRLKQLDREVERIKKNMRRRKKGGWGEVFLSMGLDFLYHERAELLKAAEEEVVEEAKIVGTTLIKSNLWPVKNVEFDTVLIDESSQVSISLALLGMVKARKYVLVGDHHQLLPVLRSVRDARRYSAFIYLKNKYPHRVKWLKRHYRSNSKIASLTRFFYEESIQPDESCRSIVLETGKHVQPALSPDKPVVFVSVEGEEVVMDGSKANVSEVEVCRWLVEELVKAGVPEQEIACISPYRAQVELLKEVMGRSVEIGTVDAFQGREKDVVIFTVTATRNFRFAADPNRLNVAFTRARKKLIVVGNWRRIRSRGGVLRDFLEFCNRERSVFLVKGLTSAASASASAGGGAGV